jgi:hypothetical protein
MSCYVPDAAKLQRLEDKDRDYPTPDYDRNPTTNELTLGYRGYLPLVSANLVNFYNEDDWALATGTTEIVPGLPHIETNWEKNQIDYKPDGGIAGPIHAGTWRYFYDSSVPPTLPLQQRASVDSTVTRYVTDFLGNEGVCGSIKNQSCRRLSRRRLSRGSRRPSGQFWL